MGNKKEKMILLALLIGSGVLALLAGTGIYLLQRKSGELEIANQGLKSRVAKAQTKIAKLGQLRLQRETADRRLRVAERILPSQEEVENLVDNLSEFALESGIIISEAKPALHSALAGRGVVKKFHEATFSLKLVGDFFQFVEFINKLENYKRFIRVDEFSIKSGTAKGSALSIGLNFATFTYADSSPSKGGK